MQAAGEKISAHGLALTRKTQERKLAHADVTRAHASVQQRQRCSDAGDMSLQQRLDQVYADLQASGKPISSQRLSTLAQVDRSTVNVYLLRQVTATASATSV